MLGLVVLIGTIRLLRLRGVQAVLLFLCAAGTGFCWGVDARAMRGFALRGNPIDYEYRNVIEPLGDACLLFGILILVKILYFDIAGESVLGLGGMAVVVLVVVGEVIGVVWVGLECGDLVGGHLQVTYQPTIGSWIGGRGGPQP
jgi:hypothetical protein